MPRTKERCLCGARKVVGACKQDHAQLERSSGQYLESIYPSLRSEVPYVGPPWILSKLKKYIKLNSQPSLYSKTLDRPVECPSCRQKGTWSEITFGACSNKECARFG